MNSTPRDFTGRMDVANPQPTLSIDSTSTSNMATGVHFDANERTSFSYLEQPAPDSGCTTTYPAAIENHVNESSLSSMLEVAVFLKDGWTVDVQSQNAVAGFIDSLKQPLYQTPLSTPRLTETSVQPQQMTPTRKGTRGRYPLVNIRQKEPLALWHDYSKTIGKASTTASPQQHTATVKSSTIKLSSSNQDVASHSNNGHFNRRLTPAPEPAVNMATGNSSSSTYINCADKGKIVSMNDGVSLVANPKFVTPPTSPFFNYQAPAIEPSQPYLENRVKEVRESLKKLDNPMKNGNGYLLYRIHRAETMRAVFAGKKISSKKIIQTITTLWRHELPAIKDIYQEKAIELNKKTRDSVIIDDTASSRKRSRPTDSVETTTMRTPTTTPKKRRKHVPLPSPATSHVMVHSTGNTLTDEYTAFLQFQNLQSTFTGESPATYLTRAGAHFNAIGLDILLYPDQPTTQSMLIPNVHDDNYAAAPSLPKVDINATASTMSYADEKCKDQATSTTSASATGSLIPFEVLFREFTENAIPASTEPKADHPDGVLSVDDILDFTLFDDGDGGVDGDNDSFHDNTMDAFDDDDMFWSLT
ncbi:hypothetical protein HDU76_002615 [Blyttiomyces sp. JEL0837]|nr:hypothetical protein HDU76_002615 [Blyttiomyces sp. JEL0837]